MSVEENKDIARQIVEKGWTNPDTLDGIIADDIAVHPGEILDLEAYKRRCAAHSAAFPDYGYDLKDIIAEGDKVVVAWEFSGTHTGEWAGAPPTNKQVSFRGMTIFRIADGKVVEQRNIWDSYRFAEQIGIVPSWAEAAKKAQSQQT